jgi:hypothetical protein
MKNHACKEMLKVKQLLTSNQDGRLLEKEHCKEESCNLRKQSARKR